MQKFTHYICLFILLLVGSTTLHAQFYQGSQNEFGKNRVQYREFLWQQYRFKEYDTYFYEGGQQLAAFASKVAKKNILELEDVFDYTISDKIQFVVYNTHADFKQSNIGITGDEQYNIGGATRIVGSKVFVYFEGDYVKFEQQIKDGIARVLVGTILYGGNWRDVIKSSTLLNLPDWYIEGLIIYASGNLDRDAESLIRDGVMGGRYEKFNRLQGRESHIAGYALWKYVADTYGENIIPNILYMSRVSRNVESGFLFVLGKSLDTITKEFIAYYKGEYTVAELSKQQIKLTELPIKTKKKRVYTQFEISPDGRYAAYVSNVLGQYRIYLYDITKGKRKKILKAEHKLERIVDYSFPVIAWHPSGGAFAYITEKRGKLVLNSYNIDDKKTTKREIFQLDKVLSMEYSPNGQQIVFSGVDNGQTDIYLYYNIGNRQERLTNDFYGDFDPSFSLDGNRIIFTSNRPDDTLRTGMVPNVIRENRDVFAFDLKSRSPYLERITDTPNIIEQEPYQYDSIRYTFRGDFEGVMNRYVATYDSTISRIDTTIHYRFFTSAAPLSNYQHNLLNYSVHPKNGRYASMAYKNGKYHFYTGLFKNDVLDGVARIEDTDENVEIGQRETGKDIDDGIETVIPIKIYEDDPDSADVDNPEVIDIYNYQFEGEQNFDFERETITITEVEPDNPKYLPKKEGVSRLDSLILPGARNYNINFTTDYVLTQLDNTFMTDFYQNLSGAENLNPGLSGLMKFGTSDLFEDYKIVGGFRIAGSFDNNTFMLSGEDLSKRLDKRVQAFRQSQRYFGSFTVNQVVTYSGAFRASWPINEVFSLRGSAIFRNDRIIPQATDQVSAGREITSQNYAGFKAEVVFDNALNLGLNLRQGIRAKAWGEYYKDPLDFERDFMTFGVDLRHYTKIHRNLIWANRLGASSSIGKERLVFFLGGVDNWLIPKQDNSLPLDPDQNYRFQTQGSPMRGFFTNSRNGNTFAVLNSELRWPVFSYFFSKPLKSDFLENFQVIGFGDVGSAWTGLTPYSDENSFNTTTIESGNLTIEVQNNRDPIVYGYGFGLRSRVLGYFVRVDWAWGVDDGVILDSVFYLSLALDF
ncbi:hypothetical protein G3O08_15585 [Cryomorpha ignava]|uniref:Translocation protein TolB n=1 Tax=Cryomorpha ignava TaxID=101383 RepID=A0A7K3WVH7_9FLAO|nr:PD40 domain-containing protein [Cryomorpha ignava]NEN24922.1 hypothetical protein [Cryomorpha ignava]